MAAALTETGPRIRRDEQANRAVLVSPPKDVSVQRKVLHVPRARVAACPHSNFLYAGLSRHLREMAVQRASQRPGARSENPVAFVQIKPGEEFIGEKVAGAAPVEPGRVVLSIVSQQTAMARRVTLSHTVENVDRITQRRDDMVAERRHIAVAARGRVVEEDGLPDRPVMRPARAHGDADFLLLDTEATAECAPQGDADGERRPSIGQSRKLQFEDVGGAAAAQRQPPLDCEPGAVAPAAAIQILPAPQTCVFVLGAFPAVRLGLPDRYEGELSPR